MRVRRTAVRVMVATMTVAVFSIFPTVQAYGQHDRGGHSGTSAECSISFPAFFSPGLTPVSQSGTFDSRGETGTINCVGQIFGHTVIGPGSFGFEGTVTDSSCVSHKGSGTSYFTVPTDAGPVHVSGGGFTNMGVGVFGGAEAMHTGVHFVGSYLLLPTEGDCVAHPLTQAQVLMNGSLRDLNGRRQFRCDLDAGIVGVNCRSSS